MANNPPDYSVLQGDLTKLSWRDLNRLGWMRWGRAPVPNLWLCPGHQFVFLPANTPLIGIDGQTYVKGVNHIDPTLLYGFLAYGLRPSDDDKPGKPEVKPEELKALTRKERRAVQLELRKGRGSFFNG